MRAVWYDQQGPAGEVLHGGDLPDPEPDPGEVRVRVRFPGVNPGDTKKTSRLVGIRDALSPGDPAQRRRRGRRRDRWGRRPGPDRASGVDLRRAVLPAHLAVDLPADVTDEVGACLGIPGITAHRTVFADGPVDGLTVLVRGVLGGVGALAAQLARWGGAAVIGTVRRAGDLQRVQRHLRRSSSHPAGSA